VSPQGRSLLTLLGFTVAAAAVGLYAYFGVLKADEAEEQRKEASDKLFSMGTAAARPEDGGAGPEPEFTRVTVRAKGDTTVVEKQPDGTWRVTAPVKAAADQYVLDSLVGQLRDGKVDEKIEEKPSDEDLARYGLKEPHWTVEATALVPDPKDPSAPKVTRTLKLEGGVENTFNGSVYLRRDSDPAVYSASGGLRFSLERSAYDLRDKQVLALDEPKVQRIEVQRAGGGFSLERAPEGGTAWRLVKPREMDADGQTVINLLGQLKSERANAFLADSPEVRRKDGLESPALDATFTLYGGEKVRIRFSKVSAGGTDQHYALREDLGGAVLAEMNATAMSHLDKSADDLRDKTVLQFKRDEVAELLFTPQGGGAAIRLARALPAGTDAGTPSAESWEVVEPEHGPAKAWKVSSNLWTLSSLQATAFVEESPKSWEKYGITEKSRQVVLLGEGGKPLTTLTVGSEVKGKPTSLYVRGTRNVALEMDSARLTDLPQKVDDVLDRPAAPASSPDAGAP